MTVGCRDLERALASDDAALGEAIRAHAKTCATCRLEMKLDEELSAAARTLHIEWDSPRLWTDTSARMQEDRVSSGQISLRRRWAAPGWQPAAAAVLVIVLGSATWFGWKALRPGGSTDADPAGRLLTEAALTEIERSEAQYVQAIDELTRIAGPKLEMPDSPLLVNLRDRLQAIDSTIAEYRTEIARNRFNAHLRRQLLWIYQEKRRTLEQVQEASSNAI